MKLIVVCILVSAGILGGGCWKGFSQSACAELELPAEKYRSLSLEERVEEDTRRRGEHYGELMGKYLAEIDSVQTGGTVFLGASLTERFPLKEAFHGDIVYNRGIGGDRVQGLRERLDVCVEPLKPEKIYILIGTNDVMYPQHESVEAWKESYECLIKELRYYAPGAEITLFSIPPFGQSFENVNTDVKKYNNAIQQLACQLKVNYIDLTPVMEDESGYLRSSYTTDDIHFTLEGYVAWLVAFLGPQKSFEPVWNLASKWSDFFDAEPELAAIDPSCSLEYPGGRGPDMLVAYTPAYSAPTTGTNEWGREAVVREGKVVEMTHHNSVIPSDGYVISGHGKAAQWITYNLAPGSRVLLEEERLVVKEAGIEELTGYEKFRWIQNRVIIAIAELQKADASKVNKQEWKALWQDIAAILLLPPSAMEEDIAKLEGAVLKTGLLQ